MRRLLHKRESNKKLKITVEDVTSQVESLRSGEAELTRTLDNKNKKIQQLSDALESLKA